MQLTKTSTIPTAWFMIWGFASSEQTIRHIPVKALPSKFDFMKAKMPAWIISFEITIVLTGEIMVKYDFYR